MIWTEKLFYNYNILPKNSKVAKISMSVSSLHIDVILGKPSREKSAVFFNIVQKAFDPPPLYLNIFPILQGVFFKTRFWALKMVVT